MTETSEQPTLLLDEMDQPQVAVELRAQGFDVIAVSDTPTLRSASDDEVFRWAAENRRWVVTENIKDFRRLLIAAQSIGQPCAHLLLTSPHTFVRSRRNPGPIIAALAKWIKSDHGDIGNEDWLHP
jgi:predicted nuclease of predicted toxin-antitoxin system